jgi:iron complex outermembrane receptor protein
VPGSGDPETAFQYKNYEEMRMPATCPIMVSKWSTAVRRGLFAALMLSPAAWAGQAAPVAAEDAPPQDAATDAAAPAATAAAVDADNGKPSMLEEVLVIGYRTRSATSATGVVTDIIDTPISISAINQQFVTDVGAAQSMEAISSLTGVTGQSNSGEGQTNFGVRGFAVTPQVDGFDTLGIVAGAGSTVGIDRIEVLKGPSAVFNGNVPPGGSINIIYKKPQFRDNETYVQAQAGSWSDRNIELSSTGPIGEHVAYLVDLYKQDADGWVDWTQQNQEIALLGLAVKPIDSISINANYRRIDTDAKVSTLPVSHEGFIGSGVPQNTYLDDWVAQNYGPNEPPQTITAERYLPGGARYNVLGPQNYNKETLNLWTGEVAYRNEFMEIRDAYAQTDYTWSYLALLQSGAKVLGPDGNVSTNFGSSNLLAGEQEGSGWENKLEAAFYFDTGFIHHSLLVGYQASGSQVDKFRVWVGGPQGHADGSAWNFFTDGPLMLQDQLDALRAVAPNPYIDQRDVAKAQTHATYLAEQMSMFDDRVHGLLGLRRTKTSSGDLEVSDTTPQVGLVVKPFARDSFFGQTALFANYSKSFTPQGILQPGTNKLVPPQKGTGKEFGIKTAWLDGAVTSTISFFRDDLENIATPDYSHQGQGGTLVEYNLGGVGRSQGMEADITWLPMKQLLLSANYTNLPVAKYLEYPGVPAEQGRRFGSTPKQQGNLTAKYSFDSGALAGLYLGTWIHAQTGTNGVLGGDWHYAVDLPGLVQVSGFAGYKLRDLDFRFNVDNLTDRDGYQMNNAFQPQSPRAYYLTVRYTVPQGLLGPGKS